MVKHLERNFAGRTLKLEAGRLAKQAAGACLLPYGGTAALHMSKVPWNGPIAAVRVGRVEGAWILNPTFQQLEFSDVDMVVSGSADSIVMVEGGALELTEAEIVKGLEVAHKGIRELLDAANELVADMRQPKMEWTKVEPPAELVARVKALAEPRVTEALNLPEKAERAQALAALKATIQEQLAAEFPDNTKDVANVIEDIEYRTMREQVLTRGERVDGRDLDTVRAISCEVGVLPRTHGSALFTRGQTQALVSVTLGTVSDEQRIDSIDVAEETSKSFMLHYNFPPFSTGEVKPIRGTSRREVGHGALAERALQALLPPYDQFPYTLRIVSDILESNGSSSMATVCGGSLALFDAGVPMTAACAGVAMGLIKEADRVAVLTDILGTEDALGDMDFKVVTPWRVPWTLPAMSPWRGPATLTPWATWSSRSGARARASRRSRWTSRSWASTSRSSPRRSRRRSRRGCTSSTSWIRRSRSRARSCPSTRRASSRSRSGRTRSAT